MDRSRACVVFSMKESELVSHVKIRNRFCDLLSNYCPMQEFADIIEAYFVLSVSRRKINDITEVLAKIPHSQQIWFLQNTSTAILTELETAIKAKRIPISVLEQFNVSTLQIIMKLAEMTKVRTVVLEPSIDEAIENREFILCWEGKKYVVPLGLPFVEIKEARVSVQIRPKVPVEMSVDDDRNLYVSLPPACMKAPRFVPVTEKWHVLYQPFFPRVEGKGFLNSLGKNADIIFLPQKDTNLEKKRVPP